jgi:hypothetical protein
MCSRFPMCSLNFRAKNSLGTTLILSLCSLDGRALIHLSSRSWQMLDSDSCKFISTWMWTRTIIAYFHHHLLTLYWQLQSIFELLHEPGVCHCKIRKLRNLFSTYFLCWWEIPVYWVNTLLTRCQQVYVDEWKELVQCTYFSDMFNSIFYAEPCSLKVHKFL